MKIHAPLALMAAFALTTRSTTAAPADRGSISIAAAANFVYALDALNAEFSRLAPAVKVTSTIGSSGALFAQIKHGAPFDVFLSADTEYPQHVVDAGLADRSTFQIFATGRLVLWTARTDIEVGNLAAAIRGPGVRKVAIAQPRAAPYGRAAQAALRSLGVWEEAEPKLVMGESVAQTAQFVETGNAELGIVAMSLVLSPKLAKKGRWTEIPPDAYASVSLDHAAVLTRRGAENTNAKRYLEFLRSEEAKKILRAFGYAVPALKSL